MAPQVSLSSPTLLQHEEPIVRRAPRDHNVPNLRNWPPTSFHKTRDATVASAVFGGTGAMSMRRMAVLQACFLLVAMFASAASRKNTLEIKVLDSQTRSVSLSDNGVPRNCDQVTFDAYCRSTRDGQLVHTLLVQEGDHPPFRIACTQESKFSKCTPLPRGETFEAKRDKHGITVYYIDDKGKARSQLYTLVDSGGKAISAATGVTVASQAVASAGGAENAAPVGSAHSSLAPAAAPTRTSAATLSAPGGGSQAGPQALPQKVKCNFSSTPAGAEISVD